MTSPLRSVRQIPDSVVDPVALREDVNRILELLQVGGLLLGGLRMDTQRTVVPVDAPGVGQPNTVMVNDAGTFKWYTWDGAAWVTIGSQS